MNKRTIATSIFAATLGMTLLASPAMATEGDIPENCISVRVVETVIVTPATTEQKLVTPAVEAVVKIEVKYVHDKNDKLEPRWEVEGWNAEDNEASKGWVATEETREVIVTPAVEAVYETVTIPAVTEEQVSHELVCEPPVIEGPVTPPAEEEEWDCERSGGMDDRECYVNTPDEEEPVAETPAEEAPVAEVPTEEVPAQEQEAPAPVISTEVGTGEATVTVQPQAAAVTPVAAAPTASTELAYTGAADWALPLGGAVLGGGIVLFGASKLRRRTA